MKSETTVTFQENFSIVMDYYDVPKQDRAQLKQKIREWYITDAKQSLVDTYQSLADYCKLMQDFEMEGWNAWVKRVGAKAHAES